MGYPSVFVRYFGQIVGNARVSQPPGGGNAAKGRGRSRAAAPGGGSAAGKALLGGTSGPPAWAQGSRPKQSKGGWRARDARRRTARPSAHVGGSRRTGDGRSRGEGDRTGSPNRRGCPAPTAGWGQAAGGQRRPAARAGRAPVPQHWLRKKGVVWAATAAQGTPRPAYHRGVGGEPTGTAMAPEPGP